MVTETKVETVEDKKSRVLNDVVYKFRDESEMSQAELTDPDYRAKLIFGVNHEIKICSKCHHCRR